jgi:pyrrolidone-carboxylate peptidase
LDKRILVAALTIMLAITLLVTLFPAHAVGDEDILVTGFGPYAGATNNISEQVIDELENRGVYTVGNLKVDYLVMDVIWGQPQTDIGQEIKEIGNVFAILSLGQHPDSTQIETVAVNRRFGKDNNGVNYTWNDNETVIDRDSLDEKVDASDEIVKACKAGLEAEDVSFNMSADAGTFLCNEALYVDMRVFVDRSKAEMAGFLHIYKGEDVSTMTDAVQEILTQIATINSTVGGTIVPIDKLGLLAPYIGLASTTMIEAVATVVYVKRVKRRREKQ